MSRVSNPLMAPDPASLLQAACSRSVVLELHRREGAASAPCAKARMLGLEPQSILLDRPQVIGRDVALGVNQPLDAFFQFGDELYSFETTLTQLDVSIRLRGDKSVLGARATRPTTIKKGQRRQFFRTSLALFEPLAAKIHRACDEEPVAAAPIDGLHADAVILDASAGGFGVRVDGHHPGRFDIYSRYFLSFRAPGATEDAVVLTELRQARSIRDGESVKLGLLVLPWPNQRQIEFILQPLQRHLVDVQRRARRSA